MRIAVADDKADVIDFLTDIAKEQGHEAIAFTDGNMLLQALAREAFDLCIVDWRVPGKTGEALVHSVKAALPVPPPLIAMADRTAKRDISDALNAGADDYIMKPEDRAVVAARIAAALKSNSAPGAFDTDATYGRYRLNRIAHRVGFNGKEIALTAKEFALADLFFRNANRTLSRRYIMQAIWRTTADLTTRTLDMHVSRVRSKLEFQPANGFRIFTVFGHGYRLETVRP